MLKKSNIALGFAARLFEQKTAAAEIEFAAKNRFAAIQFRGPEEGLNAGHLRTELKKIAAMMREARMVPALELLVGLEENGRTPTGKTPSEILAANMPAIEALAIQYVHWHLYPVDYETIGKVEVRALEEKVVPDLQAGVTLARGCSFVLAIENNSPEAPMFAAPENCHRLLKKLPYLGLVWDLNHTLPEHADSFLELSHRMAMLHVSDTPLPATNHHLPLGLGHIDFSHYLQQLQKNGFCGPAILEIGGLPISGGYGRDTDEALIASRAHLEDYLL